MLTQANINYMFKYLHNQIEEYKVWCYWKLNKGVFPPIKNLPAGNFSGKKQRFGKFFGKFSENLEMNELC